MNKYYLEVIDDYKYNLQGGNYDYKYNKYKIKYNNLKLQYNLQGGNYTSNYIYNDIYDQYKTKNTNLKLQGEELIEYKYYKYKLKYHELKYNLFGGNGKAKDDFIYDLIINLDNQETNPQKIAEQFNKVINNIKEDSNIKIVLNTIKSANGIFKDIKEMQLLLLCVFCNSINNTNVFIDAIGQVITNFYNKNYDLSVILQGIIPCTDELKDLVEKIFNIIKSNYGKNLNQIPGLQKFLTVLSLVFFNNIINSKDNNTNDNNYNKQQQNAINDIKKELDIVGVKIDDKVIIKTVSIIERLIGLQFTFAKSVIGKALQATGQVTEQVVQSTGQALEQVKNQALQATGQALQATGQVAEQVVQSTGQALEQVKNQALQTTGQVVDQTLKGIGGLFGFRGGGGLSYAYLNIKNTNLENLIYNSLRLIIDKSSPNKLFEGCLYILRIFIKIISNNNPFHHSIIVKDYLNIIDSIICFFIILNQNTKNISEYNIDYLKLAIKNIFGEDLESFTTLINNFIQSIYDTFILQTCSSKVIYLDPNIKTKTFLKDKIDKIDQETNKQPTQ